jgi:hypothetical protein
MASCVDALDFGGLFVFLGKKLRPFTIAPFPRPLGLEPETLWEHIEIIVHL